MRLRQQDVKNKHTSKQKILNIQQSKPHLTHTPKKKWIPVKIDPKGAALNAKFYKGKPKPSIEWKEGEKAKFKKVKGKSKNYKEFDRSESHWRRWEAWRNRRKIFYRRIKEKIKEASSNAEKETLPQVDDEDIFKIDDSKFEENESESQNNLNPEYTISELNALEEENKDSFHSDQEERKIIYKNIKKKLNYSWKWIDDYKSSPRYQGSPTNHLKLKEADKAKIWFRPTLTKKARNIRVILVCEILFRSWVMKNSIQKSCERMWMRIK